MRPEGGPSAENLPLCLSPEVRNVCVLRAGWLRKDGCQQLNTLLEISPWEEANKRVGAEASINASKILEVPTL